MRDSLLCNGPEYVSELFDLHAGGVTMCDVLHAHGESVGCWTLDKQFRIALTRHIRVKLDS